MKRARLTTALGVAAKGAGAAIQLLLWPIIALALGNDDFQLLVVIWAATNWLSQSALGLPVGISHTFVVFPSSPDGRNDVVNATFKIFSIFSAMSTPVLVLILMFLSEFRIWLFTESTVDLTVAIFITAILCQINGSLIIISGIRLGMGEVYKYYLWLICGSVMLIIGTVFLLLSGEKTFEVYLTVIAGAPALALFCHMLHCAVDTRPSLRAASPKPIRRSIFRQSAAPSAVHIANIAKISLPITLAASVVDIAALAAYGLCIRLAQQIVALPVMVSLPYLTPLTSDAIAGDLGSFRKRSSKILLYALTYSSILGGLFIIFGPQIIAAWLSNSVDASIMLCVFVGLLMIGWTLQGCLQPSMLALGHGRVVSALAAFEALIVMCVGLPLLISGGAEWLAATLALPILFVTVPVTLYFVFAKHSSRLPPQDA